MLVYYSVPFGGSNYVDSDIEVLHPATPHPPVVHKIAAANKHKKSSHHQKVPPMQSPSPDSILKSQTARIFRLDSDLTIKMPCVKFTTGFVLS